MKTYNNIPQPAVVLAGAAVVLFSFSAGAAFNAPGYEEPKTLFQLQAEHKQVYSAWKQAFAKHRRVVDKDIWEVESNEYQDLQEEIKRLEDRMGRAAGYGFHAKKKGNLDLNRLAEERAAYLQDEARFKELIQTRDAMITDLRKKSKLAAKEDTISWFKKLRAKLKATEKAEREASMAQWRADLDPNVTQSESEKYWDKSNALMWKVGGLLEKHRKAQRRFVPKSMKREAEKNYKQASEKLREIEARVDAASSKAAGVTSTSQTPLANCSYVQAPIIVSVDNKCTAQNRGLAKRKGSACVGTVHCVDKKTKVKYTGQAYCHLNSEGLCPSPVRCAEDNSIQTAVDKNANNRAKLVFVKDYDAGVATGSGAVH